jgi:hypothetical protein
MTILQNNTALQTLANISKHRAMAVEHIVKLELPNFYGFIFRCIDQSVDIYILRQCI